MECPNGGAVQEEGFTCHCGSAHYHAWAGGGLLVARCGTWQYWQDGTHWQQTTGPVGPEVVTTPDAPVATTSVAMHDGNFVITVTIAVDFTGQS